jgi:hypothetical protein
VAEGLLALGGGHGWWWVVEGLPSDVLTVALSVTEWGVIVHKLSQTLAAQLLVIASSRSPASWPLGVPSWAACS